MNPIRNSRRSAYRCPCSIYYYQAPSMMLIKQLNEPFGGWGWGLGRGSRLRGREATIASDFALAMRYLCTRNTSSIKVSKGSSGPCPHATGLLNNLPTQNTLHHYSVFANTRHRDSCFTFCEGSLLATLQPR